MSAYDEYDCSDLGCGPSFCDFPHCKKPRLTATSSTKMTVKVHSRLSVDELGELGWVQLDSPQSNRDAHQLGIEGLDRSASDLCPACHAPRSLPHTDDCSILLHVLATMRDSIVPGVPTTIAGHPFRGEQCAHVECPVSECHYHPPPAPLSQLGPDRGE